MTAGLMRLELSGIGKCLATFFGLIVVHATSLDVSTSEGLLIQVDRLDVPLQGFLLSELFPALLTTSLLLLFVHCNMSA